MRRTILPSAAAPAPTIAAPATQPRRTRVASAAPNAQSDGFFTNLARKVGFGGSRYHGERPAATRLRRRKPKAEARRAEPLPKRSQAKPSKPSRPLRKPALKPSVTDTRRPRCRTGACRQPRTMVAGAQPIVPSNSFDSRFSAAK